MSTHIHTTEPTRRLTRLEQLTLNMWRWAAATLQNTLDPSAVLELAALHSVLAALRDVEEPLTLFSRHGHVQPEFQLVLSLMPDHYRLELPHDILDGAGGGRACASGACSASAWSPAPTGRLIRPAGGPGSLLASAVCRHHSAGRSAQHPRRSGEWQDNHARGAHRLSRCGSMRASHEHSRRHVHHGGRCDTASATASSPWRDRGCPSRHPDLPFLRAIRSLETIARLSNRG